MSNIDKQALIAKIKKQIESFDTVVLKESEANALLDELEVISKSEWKLAGDLTEAQMNNTVLEKKLEAAEKRIAELEAREVKLPEVRITVGESRRRNLTWRELGAYNEGADVAVEKIVKVLSGAGIHIAAAGKGE